MCISSSIQADASRFVFLYSLFYLPHVRILLFWKKMMTAEKYIVVSQSLLI